MIEINIVNVSWIASVDAFVRGSNKIIGSMYAISQPVYLQRYLLLLPLAPPPSRFLLCAAWGAGAPPQFSFHLKVRAPAWTKSLRRLLVCAGGGFNKQYLSKSV